MSVTDAGGVISPAELSARLGDPSVRIVDCRFELANPRAGREAFVTAHVPGAQYVHLDDDLSAPRTATSGRHPLPPRAEFVAVLRRLGIHTGTDVIAYDDAGGMFAARFWWMLRWVGQRRCVLLDGGWRAWLAQGGATTAEIVSVDASTFAPGRECVETIDADGLAAMLEHRTCVLLDARAPERFEGRTEPLDPVAGHVPGARNHPASVNLTPDLRFRSHAELRALFDAVTGGADPSSVVSMCGSGVTACHTLFALERAGLSGAKLYAGSWSEWCRDPRRPIATGAE